MKTAARILVTGGAGYIGRSTVELLLARGLTPVVFDNFSTGFRENVKGIQFKEVELLDYEATREAIKQCGPFDAVFHFAAKASVPESCENPELYLKHNPLALLNVAQIAIETEIPYFVHSSSCSVYGRPPKVPISESSPLQPISPYGESKLIGERMLDQLAQYRPLRVMNLRYFNPAGAMNGGRLGERHEPERHLIPCLVRAVIEGKTVTIFGDDYETEDGTCIRDFIHIEDLAHSHLLALDLMKQKKDCPTSLNIATGQGTSVRQVIQAAEKVFGHPIPVEVKARRTGDPARLVADPALSKSFFHWSASKPVELMIADHHRWEVTYKNK